MHLANARRAAIAGATCLLVALPSSAWADPSPADRAAAELLFEQGKELIARGAFTEACPKFAESHRLDPGVGILLYLGDCHEKAGQLASAWTAYKEAAPRARARGDAERERIATDRSAKLAARLPKLLINVAPAARVEGLVVKRDGALVNAPLFGSAVPVDPGTYKLEASAPGRKPWSASVEAREGAVASVDVPALQAADKLTAGAPAPADTGVPWSAHHALGFVAGGLGLAGLAAGAALGVKTLGDWDEAQTHCNDSTPRLCDATGVSLTDTARTEGTASTIALSIGGAFAAAGVLLLATAPWSGAGGAEQALRVTPWASPEGAGVSFQLPLPEAF